MYATNNSINRELDKELWNGQSSAWEINEETETLYEIMPFVTIFICILGLPGNILIIKIMKVPPFNEMAHSIICTTLAIADLYYLIYLLASSILEMIMGVETMLVTFCKIWMPCVYLGFHLDAWFVVFLTYERVIAVAWPLKAGQIMTKRRVIIISIAIVIFFVLWDSVFIFRNGIVEMKYGNISFEFCDNINDFGMPGNVYDDLSDLLGTLIPLVFIIMGNICIVYKLYRQRQVRAQLGQGGGNELMKMNIMIISVTMTFVILLAPSII